MTLLDANFLDYNINSLEVINNQLSIKIYEYGPITVIPEGLTLKLASITNAMLHGGIANEKLEKEYIQSDGSISFINNLNMGSNKITGLMPGIDFNDAINKQQLDQLSTDMKNTLDPVLVVATNPISLSNFQTIDGILVSSGDRVLATNQPDPKDNGIYIVSSSIWVRASDVSNGYNMNGKYVMILAGVIYHATGWLCSNETESAIVGSDNLNIIQFSDINNIIYRFGLVFDVNTSTLDINLQDFVGNGLTITPIKKIIINVSDTSLYLDTSGIKVNASKGLEIISTGLCISLAAGFEYDSNDNLTLITNYPLKLGQTGLSLLYNFEFEINNDNRLIIKLGNGLYKDASGIHVDTDDNGITTNPKLGLTYLTSDWDIGGVNTITNIKNPIQNMDVTNKQWVESHVENLEETLSFHKDTFIISALDLINKYITLTYEPISQVRINLSIIEAPPQFYDIDYRQDNSQLKRITWDGLGLDGNIAVDDKVIVIY